MIAQETDDWLVVNKPSGLHSVRVKDGGASVEDWLEKNRPGAMLVHRLDELTSGCLLAAKNSKTFDELKKRMKSPGGIQKTYLALAEGKCRDGEFTLYFSSRYKSSKKVTVTETGPAQEKGECRWKLLEFRDGFSLLQIELIGPGKRHQIRAGLASVGHPLRGDTRYGGPLWPDHFGLHASSLKWGMHYVSIEAPWA